MAEAIEVEIRDWSGKRRNKRSRAAGKIPAVLYGHGKENLSLSVPADVLNAAVRQGTRVVDLTGGVTETALLRELQWDTFGINLLHVDFTRVSADETIEVSVSVTLRGEAPGMKEGGVIEHLVHEVLIECLASSIPEKFELNINALNLEETLTAASLKLPEGTKLLIDTETVLAQCVEPAEELEEEAMATDGAEPEVIGRKEEDEGEESK
jgi:large subunit ribosomal protein L25